MTENQRREIESHLFTGVSLLHTDRKGIGAGYKLGIQSATCDYVILSASDLPFGWTDLDSFKKSPSDFTIGSKAHPESKIEGITPVRKLMSFCFLQLRRGVLGRLTPKDSQGSLIIQTSLARELARKSQFDNYMCSLELATLQIKSGGRVHEVAVTLENNKGESSVSIRKDSVQMFKDLLKLRRSLN